MPRHKKVTLAPVSALMDGGRDGDRRKVVIQEIDGVEDGTPQLVAVTMRAGGIDDMRIKGSISDAQHAGICAFATCATAPTPPRSRRSTMGAFA